MDLHVGKDESQNRIDTNAILSTISSHQWSFEKTQSSIVSNRNEDNKILKSLQLEKSWMAQRYNSFKIQIQSLMGNHWPKFANTSTVYKWTQAQLAEMISQCKLVLKENYPTINITNSMITEFAAKIISLTIQRDQMLQMVCNVNYWISESPNYRHKYKNVFQSIIDNLKDDNATETTVVMPKQGINGYEQLKNFADQVTHHIQSNRQRNLQRYNIRKMVEQSLTPVTPLQNKEKTQTKNKESTDDLEL